MVNKHIVLFISLLFGCTILLSATTPPIGVNSCVGDNGKVRWLIWKNIPTTDLNALTHLPNFPYSPDKEITLTSLTTTSNYLDNYGSLIRGFIAVPETGNYTFNVTGDRKTHFSLSTDDSKANLQKIVQLDQATKITEYDKYPEQTSAVIPLQTGQFYYFEVLHKETTGGDFASINWRTPFTTSTDFKSITKSYIYDYICEASCPPKGTTCDDGMATTLNDVQDGACNCVGIPSNLPSCVGDRGSVNALHYDTIAGTQIANLTDHEKYPSKPDRGTVWTALSGPTTLADNYGTRVQGFLSVPVSGNYTFNITGRHRSYFSLSTDETPEAATPIAFFQSTSNTGDYEHDKVPEQTSTTQNLQKGVLYYFELLNKTTTGTERVKVFWRTPTQTDTLWRIIDGIHLHQYDCGIVCFPKDTPCDDGSSLTTNDKYDDNCTCIGTPCPNNDCSDAQYYAQEPTCGVSDEHSNEALDAWVSCVKTRSPNTARGLSHWIQYDFGTSLLVKESHIWNYNAVDDLGKGFKSVAIDYSQDGNTWQQLGIYTWAQATGAKGYTGFNGPDFGGIQARYILVTGLSNWEDGTCSGFSKIVFTTNTCLQLGQPCDDGNNHTIADKYDETCTCIGRIAPENLCQALTLSQPNIPIDGKNYSVQRTIESQAQVLEGFAVNFVAGESIKLKSGFRAATGSSFLATIQDCPATLTTPIDTQLVVTKARTIIVENDLPQQSSTIIKEGKQSNKNVPPNATTLHISPTPTNAWTSIQFEVNHTAITSLCVYSTSGKKITCLANKTSFEKGTYRKSFPTQSLNGGIYYVVLQTEKETITKPLVVIK